MEDLDEVLHPSNNLNIKLYLYYISMARPNQKQLNSLRAVRVDSVSGSCGWSSDGQVKCEYCADDDLRTRNAVYYVDFLGTRVPLCGEHVIEEANAREVKQTVFDRHTKPTSEQLEDLGVIRTLKVVQCTCCKRCPAKYSWIDYSTNGIEDTCDVCTVECAKQAENIELEQRLAAEARS